MNRITIPVLAAITAVLLCVAVPTPRAQTPPAADEIRALLSKVVTTGYANLLASLGDEFDNPATLSGWSIFSKAENWPNRIEKLDINATSKGSMYLLPLCGGWWKGFHGAYVYKTVEGDFMLQGRIMIKGKVGEIPAIKWNRGGLVVRRPGDMSAKPEERTESIVHIMHGVDNNVKYVLYSGNVKDNVYDWTNFNIQNDKAIWIDLAIVRLGSAFATMYKLDGSDWVILKRMSRPDLPSKLQAGITGCAEPFNASYVWLNSSTSIYDYNKEVLPTKYGPDVQVFVDYIRFKSPVPNEALRKALMENIASTGELSNDLLLEAIKKSFNL
ncbi:MAG: hypothetical protein EHM28_03775 [Spirochaetaceae bacterium]|nr:MAG: hypothetical protein EHM28_03775 [Spirochaetaceae bacterium]